MCTYPDKVFLRGSRETMSHEQFHQLVHTTTCILAFSVPTIQERPLMQILHLHFILIFNGWIAQKIHETQEY